MLSRSLARLLSCQFGRKHHSMASPLPKLAIFEAISNHEPRSTAIVHASSGRRFAYGELIRDVADASSKLLQSISDNNLDGQRVAFLTDNSYDYVVTLLSVLGSNAIAVPLASSFPTSELRYILENSQASILLSSAKDEKKTDGLLRQGLKRLTISTWFDRKHTEGDLSLPVKLEMIRNNLSGLMLYTSGTTSRPKGVLLPESALTAQARSLIKAWEYTPLDYILHVLPLHHIHGTVNALLTPLFAGSAVEFLFPFNATAVWERLALPYLPPDDQKNECRDKITFLTCVPTIYNRLLSTHSDLPYAIAEASKQAMKPPNLRLNISGSSALPTPTKSAWTKLSGGNTLLERYGMTEVGMALSCGLDFNDRVDGSVGWPLPFVEARLVDTTTHDVIELGDELDADGTEREGEIQLRGPTIFHEYWRNAKATSEDFVQAPDTKGPWFKTGDIATRRLVDGTGQSHQEWAKGPMYFIRGRRSVDIIKSGGEKISALEVERELLALPQIMEVAVVGLPSEQWGQKVAAVVVLDPSQTTTSGKGGKPWGVMDMRRAMKERLVNYKIPQEMKVLEELPKNAMGKVNKKNLITEIFGLA